MKQWRAQASDLFKQGDYLHSEYAARNAALAARGIPQTSANTSNPKLLEAGQVFYFNVNPQTTSTPPAGKPDLTITNIVVGQAQPKQMTLTASVANTGSADAANVTVQFLDGTTVVGSGTVAALTKGATQDVSISWNTKGISGDRVITAKADPSNTVAESNEGNNSAQRTITVRGNKVTNGSFEQSSTGSTPDGWSGTQGTTYETSGTGATDGSRAVSVTGNGGAASLLNPAWTSAPIAVKAGETYNLAMTVTTKGVSSAPSLQVEYLNALGGVVSKVSGITTKLGTDGTAQQVLGTLNVPAGVTQVRLSLVGFNPTDLSTRGTVWFDDVWMW
jgi:hypothetical protein